LRKDRVDRSQFKEKRGSASLMQYHMLQWIPKIEDEMWNRNPSIRTALQWMRNRFFFLFMEAKIDREIGGLKTLTLHFGRALLAYARSGQSPPTDLQSYAELDGAMALDGALAVKVYDC
jgi:hypothetical protein